LKLTLFPSISKWVKFKVIFHWGGARISQMQFLFAGYNSGNDGEEMEPFENSNCPPQASEKMIYFPNYQSNKSLYSKYFHIFFHLSVAQNLSYTCTHILLGYCDTHVHNHAPWDQHIHHILEKKWENFQKFICLEIWGLSVQTPAPPANFWPRVDTKIHQKIIKLSRRHFLWGEKWQTLLSNQFPQSPVLWKFPDFRPLSYNSKFFLSFKARKLKHYQPLQKGCTIWIFYIWSVAEKWGFD